MRADSRKEYQRLPNLPDTLERREERDTAEITQTSYLTKDMTMQNTEPAFTITTGPLLSASPQVVCVFFSDFSP